MFGVDVKWISLILFLFAVAQVLSAIANNVWFGSESMTLYNDLLSPDLATFVNPVSLYTYIGTLINFFGFNYAFFEGWAQLFRFMLFIPLGAASAVAVVVVIGTLIVQVLAGAGRLIGGALRFIGLGI